VAAEGFSLRIGPFRADPSKREELRSSLSPYPRPFLDFGLCIGNFFRVLHGTKKEGVLSLKKAVSEANFQNSARQLRCCLKKAGPMVRVTLQGCRLNRGALYGFLVRSFWTFRTREALGPAGAPKRVPKRGGVRGVSGL